MHYGSARQAAFIQGVFGAGKTYTTAMHVFLTSVMLEHRTLWVSHNNKPLEETAKCFYQWSATCGTERIKETLRRRFKRLVASGQGVKYFPIDLKPDERKDKTLFNANHLGVLIMTAGALYIGKRCFQPNVLRVRVAWQVPKI